MGDYRIISADAVYIKKADKPKFFLKFDSVLSNSLDLMYLKNNKNFLVYGDKYKYTYDFIKVKFDLNLKDNDKVILKRKELRKEFYENGFTLKFTDENVNKGKEFSIKYVRYKRTSGSSRSGQCLFIKEELYDYMNKWSLCGIDEESSEVKENLVSFEAYKALSLSSIEATIQIDPKSILVLDDYEAKVKDKCINVYKENNTLKAKDETIEIINSIWDGEGLLDESVFNENYYEEKGMLFLRNRFFKSCVFNTKLQRWFEYKKITDVSMLNGFTLAKNIKDIKMVVTKSSIKYLKFGSIEDFLKTIDNTFGIVKTDKKSHYFNGKVVMTGYQLINTLGFTRDEIKELVSYETNYLNLLKNDRDIVEYHFKTSGKKSTKGSLKPIDYEDDIEMPNIFSIKSFMTLKLLRINEKFHLTRYYKDFIDEGLIRAITNQINSGRLYVYGTFATIFGNGYALLLETIGKFRNNSDTVIKKGTVYCKRFKDNKDLTCIRYPHITMGNILVAKNIRYEEYDEWFNLSDEIICVDSYDDNLLQRFNGSDFDSDSLLVTSNNLICKVAKERFDEFLIPTTTMKPEAIVDKKLYEIDYDISENYVGNIVNLSQCYNSLLWEKYKKGEDISSIYKKICILAVLSGFEIDKAKRSYGIDNKKVFYEIEKEFDGKKPLFLYKENKKNKTSEDEEEEKNKKETKYRKYDTAMDMLQDEMDSVKIPADRSKNIKLIDIINKTGFGNITGYYYSKKEKVLKLIEQLYSDLKGLRNTYNFLEDNDDYQAKKDILMQMRMKYDEFYVELGKNLDNINTIYLVLKELSGKQNKIFWDTLYIIYKTKPEIFNQLFNTKETQCDLYPEKNGTIDIFGKKYNKRYKILRKD